MCGCNNWLAEWFCPQCGAGQTGNEDEEETMAEIPNFQIPDEMRDMAEKSVEQARVAFDGFIAAAQKTVTTLEDRANAAQTGAKDFSARAMSFAEQNVSTSFDFAQRLVRAQDVQEVMRLQAEFVRSQIQALSEQAKELGETVGKVAMDQTRPPRT
jgi:phasin